MPIKDLSVWLEDLKRELGDQGIKNADAAIAKILMEAYPFKGFTVTSQTVGNWRNCAVGDISLEAKLAIARLRGWSLSQVVHWLNTGEQPRKRLGVPELTAEELDALSISAGFKRVVEWCSQNKERAAAVLPHAVKMAAALSRQITASNDLFAIVVHAFESKGMSVHNPKHVAKFLGTSNEKLNPDLVEAIAGRGQFSKEDFEFLSERLDCFFGIHLSIKDLEKIERGAV